MINRTYTDYATMYSIFLTYLTSKFEIADFWYTMCTIVIYFDWVIISFSRVIFELLDW